MLLTPNFWKQNGSRATLPLKASENKVQRWLCLEFCLEIDPAFVSLLVSLHVEGPNLNTLRRIQWTNQSVTLTSSLTNQRLTQTSLRTNQCDVLSKSSDIIINQSACSIDISANQSAWHLSDKFWLVRTPWLSIKKKNGSTATKKARGYFYDGVCAKGFGRQRVFDRFGET